MEAPPNQVSSFTDSTGTQYGFWSGGTNGGGASSYIWTPGSVAYLDGNDGRYGTRPPFNYVPGVNFGLQPGAYWGMSSSRMAEISGYSISMTGGGISKWYVYGHNGSEWTELDYKNVFSSGGTYSVTTRKPCNQWVFVVAAGTGQMWAASVETFNYILS